MNETCETCGAENPSLTFGGKWWCVACVKNAIDAVQPRLEHTDSAVFDVDFGENTVDPNRSSE